MLNPKLRRQRRILRARRKIIGTSDVPRLAFVRTARHLYAQVIDDTVGKSLANFTTAAKSFNSELKSRKNKTAAVKFAEFVASEISKQGIKKIVFDRRGRKYHGVVKEFADSLRKAGIQF